MNGKTIEKQNEDVWKAIFRELDETELRHYPYKKEEKECESLFSELL